MAWCFRTKKKMLHYNSPTISPHKSHPPFTHFTPKQSKKKKGKVELSCTSAMSKLHSVTQVKVEDYVFPPMVKSPGSDKTFFLGGAGVRGIVIEGKFVKFTAIGLYLEDIAISALSPRWKGKSVDDLVDSGDFFRHIVIGPFEKLICVTMILPLTGQQYSEKVIKNCVKAWKFYGVYTDKEEKATEKFAETFKDHNFPPGNSILFTQSPLGSLTIAFSKHDSIPENGVAVIENKNMAEAMTESIIGKDGVSPETKRSLASRVSELLNKKQ